MYVVIAAVMPELLSGSPPQPVPAVLLTQQYVERNIHDRTAWTASSYGQFFNPTGAHGALSQEQS